MKPEAHLRQSGVTEGAHGRSAEHQAQAFDHTRGVPSTAAIAGHPLHPIVVPFPIAFLIGALATDLAAWWTGDPFWPQASLWLTGAGLATGVLAAALGLLDFSTIERPRVHRIGWVHAAGNSVVLALALASWLLRRDDPAAAVLPWGLLLSGATAALLVVTGWAGGELAYRHMVGVTGHGGHDDADTSEEHGGMDGHGQEQSTAAGLTIPADGHGGVPPAGADHATMGHGATEATLAVTRPQLIAVSALTLLALAAGVLWTVARTNLTIAAPEVEDAVMAPGMIMTRDTPAGAMRDMAAVNPDFIRYSAPADARGDQPLEPRIEGGVKVFDLETSVIEWNILPDETVMAYAFNNQVPGPRIRVTEGDRVRINVTNNLPESTTVHWHGLIVPNAMDGPAEVTQDPIQPGETFTYEFVLEQRGTFFYHTHDNADRQQALGLYGALIIDPREPGDYPYEYDQELVIQLQELLERDDYSFPAMPMEGALPNFFAINGKSYPETQTVRLRVGETLLVRFIGTNSGFIHPMHIHGGPFRIVETDGNPVEPGGQWIKDTVNVAPGERYDVLWEAREPGKWLLHCHILHHTTNNNVEVQGAGGLTLIIEVTA